MNSRRSFFKGLFGLLVAPKIKSNSVPLVGVKGMQFLPGIVYAPYIPLLVMTSIPTDDISSNKCLERFKKSRFIAGNYTFNKII
jgi:hypothetical protein